MIGLMLMAQQAASLGEPWDLATRPPLDLRAVTSCPAADSNDVVVCARRDPDRYRLKSLSPEFEKPATLPLAQMGLGGGTLGVTTQQVMIGNIPSNRVMVSIKLPF